MVVAASASRGSPDDLVARVEACSSIDELLLCAMGLAGEVKGLQNQNYALTLSCLNHRQRAA